MQRKPTYGVFTNNKTQKKLVYYPCPKNANTSIKMFLVKHLKIENKFEYRDDVPRYLRKPDRHYILPSISSFLTNYVKFHKIKAHYKMCVIRDPIERFISAYENRILFHKDSNFLNMSVNEIIEEMSNKNFKNRHFIPQNYFLGNNLKYYTHIYTLQTLNLLKYEINKFFNSEIDFPHLQKNKKDKTTVLTKYQISKLMDIYAEDYNILHNYI